MSKQRRTVSPEFKRSAASLVLDQRYSHVDASRSVGVAESFLRRGVQQLHQERRGITPRSIYLLAIKKATWQPRIQARYAGAHRHSERIDSRVQCGGVESSLVRRHHVFMGAGALALPTTSCATAHGFAGFPRRRT